MDYYGAVILSLLQGMKAKSYLELGTARCQHIANIAEKMPDCIVDGVDIGDNMIGSTIVEDLNKNIVILVFLMKQQIVFLKKIQKHMILFLLTLTMITKTCTEI